LGWALIKSSHISDDNRARVLEIAISALSLTKNAAWLVLMKNAVASEHSTLVSPFAGQACNIAYQEGFEAMAELELVDPLLALLRECVRSRIASFASCESLTVVIRYNCHFLKHTAGSEAKSALSLACSLLSAPFGGNTDTFQLQLEQVMGNEGAGVLLVLTLLEAANGDMPSSLISDIADALYNFWSTCTSPQARSWITEATAQHCRNLGKSNEKHQAEFLNELLGEACSTDNRKFKRCLKAFCGGKKKGANN